jgi:hypothetical protein
MELVANYSNGKIVFTDPRSNFFTKEVIERVRKGYYQSLAKLLPFDGVGIDLRGKTKRPVHSYVIGGMTHYLDDRAFFQLQRFLKVRPNVSVLVKQLMEEGRYSELEKEYALPGSRGALQDRSVPPPLPTTKPQVPGELASLRADEPGRH